MGYMEFTKTERHITCDSNCNYTGFDGSLLKSREGVEKEAIEYGWTRDGGKWICPMCSRMRRIEEEVK